MTLWSPWLNVTDASGMTRKGTRCWNHPPDYRARPSSNPTLSMSLVPCFLRQFPMSKDPWGSPLSIQGVCEVKPFP